MNIQWFQRVLECLTGRNRFNTAELEENFLQELIKLRDALGDLKLNAEEYLKEANAASKTLEKVSNAMSVLRAVRLV